ncbi:MAG TPA: hypothetical protein EYN37_00875 [Dehalococcoidia bacterium]|nr:hypothetical protein [Dehalococcoidia bacterium]
MRRPNPICADGRHGTRSVLSLGERRFDAAVCNNALMDMPTIQPLADSLCRRLKPNGRFVFSIPHPCFNAVSSQKTVEQVELDGQLDTKHSVKMSEYINGTTGTGIGIKGHQGRTTTSTVPSAKHSIPSSIQGLSLTASRNPSPIRKTPPRIHSHGRTTRRYHPI